MLPAVEVTTDKLSHKLVEAMLFCRLLKCCFLSTHNTIAAVVQAIHHKVHFLINSSLQACQDSSKGPIQPTALLALCCSLQILEVCLTCLPNQSCSGAWRSHLDLASVFDASAPVLIALFDWQGNMVP